MRLPDLCTAEEISALVGTGHARVCIDALLRPKG